MASDEKLVPIEEVTTFYAVAYASSFEVNRVVRKRDRYIRSVEKEGREWTEDDLDFLTLNGLNPADEERLAMVTVIFCALTLEALINDYMIFNSSKKYLKNYLDGLPPLSKWLVFPKLITGNALNTDRQVFQYLKELFTLRNELAHFKTSRETRGDSGERDRITKKHASDAIKTVRLAVMDLEKLDPRVSTLWIQLVEEAKG